MDIFRNANNKAEFHNDVIAIDGIIKTIEMRIVLLNLFKQ